jgi:hypothetical protein
MSIVDDFAHLGGSYVNNKVRATVRGASVVVARMGASELELTDEGRQALADFPIPEAEEAKKTPRVRKSPAVESVDEAPTVWLDAPAE